VIVVDASVAAKAYLEETGSDEAIALLAGRERLHAPELIRVEVAAALCRRVRRGELQADEALVRCEHWLGRLAGGLIGLTPDRELITAAAALAAELKHPLQDCLYLAEARRLDAPLLTADRAFRDRVAAFDPRVSLLAGRDATR